MEKAVKHIPLLLEQTKDSHLWEYSMKVIEWNRIGRFYSEMFDQFIRRIFFVEIQTTYR